MFATLASAQTPAPGTPAPPLNPVQGLPKDQPAWLAGYRIRYPLRVVGDPEKQTSQSVIARLPTGGWLKSDGSDVAVQTADGKTIPVNVLSHDAQGDTIIQFKRNGNDKWYWVYGVNPNAAPAKADPIQEGLVAEFRQWEGEKLDSWPTVLEGLKKSENVIGNGLPAEVVQNVNPIKPSDPRKFAASYRGFLKIDKPGVYRFFVNSDDASFLFIDGFKVTERTGSNVKLTGRIPLKSVGADIELTAGVHAVEVHHVMGNNPAASGSCSLIWLLPEAKNWAFVPRANFVPAMYGMVADIQEASGGQASAIGGGVDDAMISGGVGVYLARLEAQGKIKDPSQLKWDFGDNMIAQGRDVWNVYFREGFQTVSLISMPGLPAFRRRVCVWATPGRTSPLSLSRAVETMTKTDWKRMDAARINQMYEFLLVCEQKNRWPLLEAVSKHLLAQSDIDPAYRATLYSTLMQSQAQQGRGRDAVKLADAALKEFEKLPSQRVTVNLAVAQVYGKYLKELEPASKLYEQIVTENRRVAHPDIRVAAIRWGDLYAEMGDIARAGELYKLANTLGSDGIKGATETTSDLVSRGAALRIAEQKLKSGDIRETRLMLEKLEMQFPEQKLEGLYRFLKAESDRFGGRYEDAVTSYEVLLRLPQWAGYRDRALHGIADAYYRDGDFERALEWMAKLKESFPKYYEEKKLGDMDRILRGRLARLKAARDAVTTAGTEGQKNAEALAAVSFQGFVTGFEPDETVSYGTPSAWSVVRGPGMLGPHVGLMPGFPVDLGNFNYSTRLRNLTSEGWYWVEFWYRENLESAAVFRGMHTHVYLYGTGNDQHPSGNGTATVSFDRTFGQWRKQGFLVRAPVTQDGRVDFSIRLVSGVMEIDAFSILPVSDRQMDSLANFIEGKQE